MKTAPKASTHPPQHVTMTELRRDLTAIIEDTEEGGSFMIEARGQPVAALSPLSAALELQSRRGGRLSPEEIKRIKGERKATAAQALGAAACLWDSDEEFEDFVQGIEERRAEGRAHLDNASVIPLM